MQTLQALAFGELMTMRLSEYFNIKQYASDGSDTIYFIGPYGGRTIYFNIFIQDMRRRGYSVVYIQPEKSVLDVFRPANLHFAIERISAFIQEDIIRRPDNKAAIVGVSLGSFIGVNLLGDLPINKYIAIAGGAEILSVFRDDKLFRAARKKLDASEGGADLLYKYWQQYDVNFKERDLHKVQALVINSNGDRMITPNKRERFLDDLSSAGALVSRESYGRLPHKLQAMKTNLLTNRIHKFIQSA